MQIQHDRTRLPRGFGGPIRGPVVHDEHVVGESLPERADQPPDRPLLLVGGEDDQDAWGSSFHSGIHTMILYCWYNRDMALRNGRPRGFPVEDDADASACVAMVGVPSFVFLFLNTEYKDNDVLPYAVNLFSGSIPDGGGRHPRGAGAHRAGLARAGRRAPHVALGRFFCGWFCPLAP